MMFAEINPDLILLFILCCQFQVSKAAKRLPTPIRYPQLLQLPRGRLLVLFQIYSLARSAECDRDVLKGFVLPWLFA